MKELISFAGNLFAAAKPKTPGKDKDKDKGELILSNLPLDAKDGVRHVIDTINDYLKTAEQEKTNRAEIEANKAKALLIIESQRELMAKLIDRTFDERGQVLAKQFSTLDHALASGDVALVQASLNGMVSVIQTSPFKTVEQMQQSLGMKDFVVRLE